MLLLHFHAGGGCDSRTKKRKDPSLMMPPSPENSFEKQRRMNIERNQEFFIELGLPVPVKQTRPPRSKRRKRQQEMSSQETEEEEAEEEEEMTTPPPQERAQIPEAEPESVRRRKKRQREKEERAERAARGRQ